MTPQTARRSTRPLAILAALLVVMSSLGAFQIATTAQAADASRFDPGNIISDANFYNSGTMSAAQVQSFIQGKGASCVANSLRCLKDVSVANPAQPASSYCAAMPANGGRNAGSAIVAVAQACGINPQVFLVLIEKEQSLVTRTSPSAYAYTYATGFGCPDTSGCSDAVAGFFVQLHSAGEQFQRYRKNPGSYNFQAGRVNNIQYHPNTGCGTKTVYIQNQATAGLYDYTPYTPNTAALNNIYGTGDSCSSYGNRNFWRIFTDWFGDPAGASLTAPGFETGVGNWVFNGNMDRAVYPAGGRSGPAYLATVPHSTSASLAQTVPWPTTQGQTYTASVWLRAPVGAVSGSLAVWGLGGTNENAVTNFTVSGSTWTQVSTRLLVEKAGHSAVRIEVYYHTVGRQLDLDDASLLPGDPMPTRQPLALHSGGFETGIGGWFNGGAGQTNQVIYTGAGAPEGNSIFATNTPVRNRSFAQDVTTKVDSTTGYTATMWFKSATGVPYNATLALWSLGGTNVSKSTNFTVGKDWTRQSVTLPVVASGQTKLRIEVYLNTLAPATLYADGATLAPNLLPDGSFEQGGSGWAPREAGTNLAVYTSGAAGIPAVDGGSIGASNVPVANNSVQVDLARRLQANETYTASVWLRAEKGKTLTATLALWELGDANSNAAKSVTVGDTWQEVQVSKKILSSTSAKLRLQLYELTPGVTVFMDGARLY